MTSPIPIVYCFDAKYSNYAAVSIFSLFLHALNPIKIYCLVPSRELSDMNPIIQVKSKFGIDISLIGVQDEVFISWKTTNHLSSAVYLRLLIPDLINEDKIIYLDSDTLVLGDLSEMYQIDLTHNIIAGVEDIYKGKNSNVPRAKEDRYINAGVMLMNLGELRQDKFFEKCEKIYHTHEKLITLQDQCIINKYAETRKTILEKKWNFQIFSNQIKQNDWNRSIANDGVTIVHFLTETKPWSQWCSPFISEFWWGYANKLILQNLRPTKISNFNQMISLAMALDLNEKYKEASIVKDQIIRGLMARQRRV